MKRKNQTLEYQVETFPVPFEESKYLAVLNPVEHKRYFEFQDVDVKKSFIYSRFLLKTRLSQELKTPAEKIHFLYTSQKKPFLENSNIHFSITHSGIYCGFALSVRPIGIDIQLVLAHPSAQKILNRWGHPNEAKVLESLDASQKEDFFYKIWVLKEAWGKALGTGLNEQTKGHDFSEFALHTEDGFDIDNAHFEFSQIRSSRLEQTYFLATCEL